MKRPGMRSLIAMVALVIGVIFQGVSHGAAMPVLESLGQIKDISVVRTPMMIDVDAAGNLYVSDMGKKAILKLDRYGKPSRQYTGFFMTCRGLAVTPDGSRLYVSGKDFVAIMDGASGEIVGYLGSGIGEFNYVGEIDLDASGFIFAADSGSSSVKVYSPDGRFQYQFGSRGTTNGKFLSISGLTVDPGRNEVYVLDTQENPRVQVFDLAGKFKRIFYGTSAANLGIPYMAFLSGMTVDDVGRAYFLEMFYGQIRYQDIATAKYLGSYNKKGYKVGELIYPYDAIYDSSTGRLFVSCQGSRIEIFGVDGAKNPENANEAPGKPTLLSPVGESEVFTATPVLKYSNAVDPDGDTLVYDVRLTSDAGGSVASYTGLPESEGTSWAQVSESLQENARYLWSAQAFDGEASSGWTESQGFWVNAVEEAPSVPVAASLSADVLDGSGVLGWEMSTDPDPFDTVSYVVEVVAADGTVVTTSEVAGLSVGLSDFEGYALLEDGATYSWRVKAVDNHGEASAFGEPGTFRYDTSILAITTNMPGATVYLGGNLAYAGESLGVSPVEARDFAPGTYSVVVERAGFEPWVSQVRVGERENVSLYAELVPAVMPIDLKARTLEAAGEKIDVGTDAAPFLVDFNNDGVNDLLVGNASGVMTLYEGRIVDGEEIFVLGAGLDLPLVPGASPFVVDWNDDGRKDLLLGGADGTVTFFANTGLEDAPAFGAGELLQIAGEPIDVGSDAVPAVIDLDGDGDKDLVVGSASGILYSYSTDTTGGTKALVHADPLVQLSSPVAPFFADWNGNGTRDLLLSAGEHLYRYVAVGGGKYTVSGVLTVGADLLGKNGKSESGAYVLGRRLRIFGCDVDGKKGKDLIIGNSDGEVRLAHAGGNEYVPAYFEALSEKAIQIETLVGEGTAAAMTQLQNLEDAIANGDFKEAQKVVQTLLEAIPSGAAAHDALLELSALL